MQASSQPEEYSEYFACVYVVIFPPNKQYTYTHSPTSTRGQELFVLLFYVRFVFFLVRLLSGLYNHYQPFLVVRDGTEASL